LCRKCNKRISVKLYDIPLRHPTLDVLSPERITELIRSVVGVYEDSFQDAC